MFKKNLLRIKIGFLLLISEVILGINKKIFAIIDKDFEKLNITIM